MAGRIFINYRHSNAQGSAGRLYDRLLHHFPRGQLFMDVDAIEPGVDFTQSINDQLTNCSAFICVIGPGWATVRNPDGRRRLEDPTDYVRVELEAALARDIRVIPALVDGGVMPQLEDLPPGLQPLARRNAFHLAHHGFAADCDELAHSIKRAIGIETNSMSEATAAPEPIAPPSLVPTQAPRRLSWPETFFSFRGRISRGRYFVGLVIVLSILLIIFISLAGIINAIFAGDAFVDRDTLPADLKRKLDATDDAVGMIFDLLLTWPAWALTLKRLHDLGYGWPALLPIIGLDIAITVLQLAKNDDAASYLAVFLFGILFVIAALKGNTGPNAFGPDPLEKAPRAS